MTRYNRLPATIYMLGAGRFLVNPTTKQVSKSDGHADSRAGTATHRGPQGAAVPRSDGAVNSLPPLPRPGDKFTEDQLRERFGVNVKGGIRPSLTSSDIILVRNVYSDYDNVERGKRITYAGQYYKAENDQLISNNLKLAKSRENGNRVLYFVKQGGMLEYSGLSSASSIAARMIPRAPVRWPLNWRWLMPPTAQPTGGRAYVPAAMSPCRPPAHLPCPIST